MEKGQYKSKFLGCIGLGQVAHENQYIGTTRGLGGQRTGAVGEKAAPRFKQF